MHVSVIPASELDSALAQRWQKIQAGNPALSSPYFSYQYTQAVASVRDDVFVAMMEEGNETVGFFPFQKNRRHIGGPVGGRMSDYHGIVVAPRTSWDLEQLFDACDLKIWDFDHLLPGQKPFEPYYRQTQPSPVVDMAQGFEHYVQEKRAAGSKQITQLKRKWRGFERDIGPLRFELYSNEAAAFSQVIEWKREQCRRTGVVDFMGWGWTSGMLDRIWHEDSDDFAGILSVLYHEDEIVAAHMGMRSATVCHWWFPVYNYQYNKYSPGALLLMKLASEVADRGILSIDLGKGDDRYKKSFANSAINVSEGSVMLPSLATSVRKAQTLGMEHIVRPAKQQLRTIRDFAVNIRT